MARASAVARTQLLLRNTPAVMGSACRPMSINPGLGPHNLSNPSKNDPSAFCKRQSFNSLSLSDSNNRGLLLWLFLYFLFLARVPRDTLDAAGGGELIGHPCYVHKRSRFCRWSCLSTSRWRRKCLSTSRWRRYASWRRTWYFRAVRVPALHY